MITNYLPSATDAEFHKDNSFVRILMGPVQSGKTLACVAELISKATTAEPMDVSGRTGTQRIRSTIFAVLTDSQDATTAVMSDVRGMLPSEFMTVDKNVIRLKFKNDPDTITETVWVFTHLITDIMKMRLSGAWASNARDLSLSSIISLTSRVGLYPSPLSVEPFIIMDTLPPSTSSWIFSMVEDIKQADWKLFKKPSARSAFADNIANLPVGFYDRISKGRSDDWIDVYIHGNYGSANYFDESLWSETDLIEVDQVISEVDLSDVELSI